MTTQAPSAAGSPLFGGALRSTSVGILVLITLIAFEEMAVAPALPTVARDLHGLGSYGWAFTGFLVANVVGMVVAGQVSDVRGPRTPLAAGMLAFVLGLGTSGSAVTMVQLVGGRVVQGFGGGLLITAIYVVIGERYPQAVQPKVFAALSSAWVVPSLAGPVLSGAVTEHVGWRWVFLGLLPLVLAGCVLMLPVLGAMGRSADRAAVAARHGRVVRAIAVAAGIAVLEQAGQHPAPAWFALGGAGLVALVWGLRGLLPYGTVRARRGVPSAVALRGLLAGAFFGVEAMVPLSLTIQHGFSATAAGLPLAFSGLSWAVGAWWQGRDVSGDEQTRRVRLARSGFTLIALAAIGIAAAARLPGGGLLAYPAWAVAGLGGGLTMSTLSVLLLRYTNDADRGADSASLQLADVTSSAVTTGAGGALIAAATAGALTFTTVFTTLDLAMAAIAFLGALAAGQLRAPQAVASQP